MTAVTPLSTSPSKFVPLPSQTPSTSKSFLVTTLFKPLYSFLFQHQKDITASFVGSAEEKQPLRKMEPKKKSKDTNYVDMEGKKLYAAAVFERL